MRKEFYNKVKILKLLLKNASDFNSQNKHGLSAYNTDVILIAVQMGLIKYANIIKWNFYKFPK